VAWPTQTACTTSIKTKFWRFGVRTEPVKESTVIIEDDLLQSLEGRHFTVFAEGLIGLHRGTKAFALEDILRNYRKYLSDPNHTTWIRRYLSIQYLASQKETKHLYIESGGSEDAFERAFGSHLYYYGIVKTLVSRFYLFKVAFTSKVEDLKTRFTDAFGR
jgi:hypothetical protein